METDIKIIIDEVLKRTSIVELAERYTSLKKTGNKYSGKCPFHNDTKPSLIVYPESNSWFCFACNIGGSPYDWLMKAEDIGFYEALKRLAEPFQIDVGDRRNFKTIEVEEFKRQKVDKVLRTLMLYFLKSPEKAREYLSTRGINEDIAKTFRIGWANLQEPQGLYNYLLNNGFAQDELKYYPFISNHNAFFTESAIYPLIDTKGRIQNLISGSINGRNPKYMTLKGLTKNIFNLNKAQNTDGAVYITEGILDCIAIEQQNLNAVATLGIHTSESAQKELLLLKEREVIIAFDNDEAGRLGTFHLCEILPNARILVFPKADEKIDPNSYLKEHSIEEFKALETKDGLGYRIEYILAMPADKRTDAIKSLFPVIKSKDAIEQAHYQQVFEKKLHINKQKFNAYINDIHILEIEDTEKRGTVIEILENQFNHISPALDFINDKAYISVPLPVKVKIKDREIIESRNYVVTSDRERFELTQHNLFQRRLFAGSFDLSLPKRWSSESINRYLKDGGSISIKEVYGTVKEHLKGTVELVSDNYYSLISIWLLGTYFHPLFNCYGFLFCNGVKESGKTKLLSVCSLIAFNGALTSNISPSAIFRSIDAEHCSLFIDELENLGKTDLQELRSVLLGSYKKGSTVKRTELVGNRAKVVNYQTFSPKAVGNISGADDVIISRSIPIPMFRSLNPQIINNEVLFTNTVYQDIRDSLYLCLMNNFKAVKQTYEKIESKDFKGRFWEITKPLLTIAKLIDQQTYDALYEFFRELQDERDKNNYSLDLDSKIVFAISNLLRENKDTEGKLLIDAKNIIKYFRDTEDDELTFIQSVQLGKIINRIGLCSSKKIKVVRGKHTLVYEFDVDRVKLMAERLRLKVFL